MKASDAALAANTWPMSPTRPAAAEPAVDAELPTLDVRALARRAAVPAAVLVVALVAFVVADGPLQTFAAALGRAVDADPRWVAAAAVFEVLSFVGYVGLLWLVGGGATLRLGLRASIQVTLGGAAATRLLPTGGVGGVALTVWAFRRTGLGTRAATRTLLAFLSVLYSVFLGSIAVAGGLLALGLVPGAGPLVLSAIPAAAAALAIAAALVLAARPASESRAGVVGAGVRDALAVVRRGDARLLGAPMWWAFDAAVLWAMLHALGTPPPLAVVALGYFVGQLANTIPIPGAVSGGMVGVLLAFGVEADLALASVLAYRAIAIWLPAPFGLAALAGLRRTVARWERETAPVLPARPQASRPRPRQLPLREPAMQAAA